MEIPFVQEQEGMLLAESFGGLREEVEEEQPVQVVLLAWPLRSLFSLIRPCDSFTNNTNLFLSLVSGLVREVITEALKRALLALKTEKNND